MCSSFGNQENLHVKESLHSEESKLRLKNALIVLQKLLLKNHIIASKASPIIPHDAHLIGQEIFENIIHKLTEKQIIHDDELIDVYEECAEVVNEVDEDDDSWHKYEPD